MHLKIDPENKWKGKGSGVKAWAGFGLFGIGGVVKICCTISKEAVCGAFGVPSPYPFWQAHGERPAVYSEQWASLMRWGGADFQRILFCFLRFFAGQENNKQTKARERAGGRVNCSKRLLQRSDWFPAPILGSLQWIVTLAPGDLVTSSGLRRHCTQMCCPTHIHMYG